MRYLESIFSINPYISFIIVTNESYDKKIPDNLMMYQIRNKGLFQKLRYLLLNIIILLNKNTSILHIKYLSYKYLLIILIAKLFHKKIIITVYGSDIKVENLIIRQLLKLSFFLADEITCDSVDYSNKIKSIIHTRYPRIINHGTKGLTMDFLSKLNKKYLRQKLGFSSSLWIITLGYNSSRNMNHRELLEAVEPLLDNETVHFILPLNYGNDISELDIEKYLSHNSITVLETKLDFEEIMEYRAISDVFITMQDSDQLSSSIAEYLLTDNIVIMPTWINYYEYANMGINFFTYTSNSELLSLIYKILDAELDFVKNDYSSKLQLIELFSIDTSTRKFVELYEI